jgi:ABC-type sugar transport system ATPase subunit
MIPLLARRIPSRGDSRQGFGVARAIFCKSITIGEFYMSIQSGQEIILETRGIVKDFPGQRALDHVDFDVRPGEVHALVGENGAGKSTLVRIIAGLYRADEGEILIDGKQVEINTPHESGNLGLAFIHQELSIVPHLSVAENIFLGRYPMNRLKMVKLSKMVEMAKGIPDALNVGVDLRTPAVALSVIQQWKTMINRALAMNARIIFMDEPTSSLTHEEVNELFSSIEHLKSKGTAIVYISHRMEEVFQIADRVTVIKDSQNVGTANIADMDLGKLYHMILGRELSDVYPPHDPPQDKVLLEVKHLSRGRAVNNVSFQLHAGEILGIAGLVGAGRTELARLIFGADRKHSGEIFIEGKPVNIKNTKDAIRHKVALVPEERRRDGLVLQMDIKQNITLASLQKLYWWPKIPLLRRSKESSAAKPYFDATAIKATGLNQQVAYLSGGNQQKVVLSKWLCSKAKILIFDEPTRGIDVGAKFAIYQLIVDLARQGVGIILISSDLTEVVGLAHQILVMDKGAVKAKMAKTDLKEVMEVLLAS